uniref:Uncharacterized protein n=1 Tax=Rhizophagus irregularis (strain DAOM 181602 / DAOM 197198 / MUCL 43194) TaxID=747089 RepID=U9UE63_RHIID
MHLIPAGIMKFPKMEINVTQYSISFLLKSIFVERLSPNIEMINIRNFGFQIFSKSISGPSLASIKDQGEVTGEERNLLLTLKDCQFLHNDLIQANDEAFELQPIMQDEKQEGDPKAGPGSTIQAHREGYKKEVVPTP